MFVRAVKKSVKICLHEGHEQKLLQMYVILDLGGGRTLVTTLWT